MKIKLSDKFNYKKLLRFSLPSIIMMIFTSVYGVVDGFFVSNFAGKDAFTALNYIMPVLMILGAAGFMFGAGGSALVAAEMGRGDNERANRIFSLLVYVTVAVGVVFGILGFVLLPYIAAALKAEGQMLTDCIVYGRIVLIALPFFMLQYEFQSFFVTAEKPNLGLLVTIAAGVANIILDALFVWVFDWGLVGAASATAVSQAVGGIIPIIYFACPNRSRLRLGKAKFEIKAVFKASANGSSELLSNIAMSVVSMLYNAQLMKYIGKDGVAAYGVLMYVNMIFLAIFIGYSVGTAPVISYNYGAGNREELKSLLKKSLVITAVSSALMFVLAEVLAYPLSIIFVGYDKTLLDLTLRAFFFFSFSFLFAGIAVFGSSFFTALNNGLVSALISFLRTLVFQIAAVLLLPLLFGVDGIWVSIVVAEFMAAVLSAAFMLGNRKKYGY